MIGRMRKETVVLGGVLGGALLLAADAQAKCAAPQPVIFAGADKTVPADPVLYLFWPHHGSERIALTARDEKDRPLRLELTAVDKNEAFSVHRIKLTTGGARTVKLKLPEEPYSFRRVSEWSFRVDPAWAAAAAAAANGSLAVREVSTSWTCSYQLSQNLQVPQPAAAFRVAIADSEADYRAGRLRSALFPYHMRLFFAPYGDKPEPPAQGEIQLGHSNCVGASFTWPAHPVYVGVFALRPDGSEAAVGQAPVRLEPPRRTAGAGPEE